MSDEPTWPDFKSALSPRARRAVGKAIRELEAAYSVLNGQALSSPDDTRDYLKCKLYGLPYEVFACLLLDNRHRILRYEELSRGTIDGASVHPREVVRVAMQTNAAAVILAHNHPSGLAEPSQADIRITQRLKEALALVEVRVLDHFIIGDGPGVSLAERGML
jgi:DNA repair protein RadC